MPKQDFIKVFAGNETSTEWLSAVLSSSEIYATPLANFKDIERSIAKMNALERDWFVYRRY